MSTSYPEPEDKSTPEFHRLFKHIARRTDLSQSAKMLYCVIVNLCEERGHCFASDAYLGAEIGMTARTARATVAELEQMRLVLVTGATKKRMIRPAPGVPQLRQKNDVVDSQLRQKSAGDAPQLRQKSDSTPADFCHIKEKNKKEKIKESLPSASQEQNGETTYHGLTGIAAIQEVRARLKKGQKP